MWPARPSDCQAVPVLARLFLLSKLKVKYSLQHRRRGTRWGCRWKFAEVNMPSGAASVEIDHNRLMRNTRLFPSYRSQRKRRATRQQSQTLQWSFLLFLLFLQSLIHGSAVYHLADSCILSLKRHHIDPFNTKEIDFVTCGSPRPSITCCITEELAC